MLLHIQVYHIILYEAHLALFNSYSSRFILSAVPSINWTYDHQTYFAQMVGKVNRVLQKMLRHPEHHVRIAILALFSSDLF